MALVKKFTAVDGIDAKGSLLLDGKRSTRATVANTAPTSPAAGNLWYDTDSGKMYMYFTDVDSSQWVEISIT
jgi:hypothetical protein